MTSFSCRAEESSASRSFSSRGISSTVSTPSSPTMEGTLRHRPSRPYWPSSSTDTGSMACSSFMTHSAMRATAMAMP